MATTTNSNSDTPRRRGRPPKSAAASTDVQTEKGSEVEREPVLPTADVEVPEIPEPEKGSEVDEDLKLEDFIDISGGALLLPAQFEADPWGETPLQMRQGA